MALLHGDYWLPQDKGNCGFIYSLLLFWVLDSTPEDKVCHPMSSEYIQLENPIL